MLCEWYCNPLGYSTTEIRGFVGVLLQHSRNLCQNIEILLPFTSEMMLTHDPALWCIHIMVSIKQKPTDSAAKITILDLNLSNYDVQYL